MFRPDSDTRSLPRVQPAQAACARLGVGLTILKRICRSYGVAAWPYRKRYRSEAGARGAGVAQGPSSGGLPAAAPRTPPSPHAPHAPRLDLLVSAVTGDSSRSSSGLHSSDGAPPAPVVIKRPTVTNLTLRLPQGKLAHQEPMLVTPQYAPHPPLLAHPGSDPTTPHQRAARAPELPSPRRPMAQLANEAAMLIQENNGVIDLPLLSRVAGDPDLVRLLLQVRLAEQPAPAPPAALGGFGPPPPPPALAPGWPAGGAHEPYAYPAPALGPARDAEKALCTQLLLAILRNGLA